MTNEELKALRTQIAQLQRQLALELRARNPLKMAWLLAFWRSVTHS